MQLKSLQLHNFMPYDDVRFDLPACGVVAVTGCNGSGKSAIVEGLAWALWGETLRGESPIADEGKPCSVVAEMDTGLVVSRTRKGKGATAIKVVFPDGNALDGATAKHTQSELEHVIGSFDSWRRTRVFSSQDAAHFSLATDAERKRLLEGILDLERFDEALKRCRVDLSATNRIAEDTRRRYEVQDARLKEMRVRLEDARRGLASMPEATRDVAITTQDIAHLEADVAVKVRQIRDLQAQIRGAGADAAKAQAAWAESERGLARIKTAHCPTCGQDVSEENVRGPWRGEIIRLRAAADMARNAATVLEARLTEELNSLLAEQEAARARAARLAGELRAQEGQRSAAATFRKTIGLAERELTQAEAVLEAARQAHVESGFKAVKLAACEGVLGLRGVRSQVLAKALPGVEAAANAWLSRVAGGDVSLSLSATSELKGGGEVEKIGLSLKGLAGGHGYRAASGGQRRRVDVALLLALADIAGAARARAPETLWMDEIFDCLDEDGTTAVAGLLEELSRNRTVLVITHAPGAWLRAAAHIQVDAGRLVTI